MLNILQRLPNKKSPNASPRKKGIALRYDFNPPCFKIVYFRIHVTNKQHQRLYIPQLFAIAYPSGWSGHHKKRVLKIMSSVVNIKPTPIKLTAGTSVLRG
jgi:hypothetical protein